MASKSSEVMSAGTLALSNHTQLILPSWFLIDLFLVLWRALIMCLSGMPSNWVMLSEENSSLLVGVPQVQSTRKAIEMSHTTRVRFSTEASM